MSTSWHTLKKEDVLEILKSSEFGLNSEEITVRQNIYGKNILIEKGEKSSILAFFQKFTDFMVIVLLIAAIISAFAGDLTDAIIILVIIMLNVLISFIQEFKAEKVMDALKKLSTFKVNVVRDNKNELIVSDELVPGDILVLEAGNIVGADLRLMDANHLFVEEAMLTGESFPVLKKSVQLGEEAQSTGDLINMAFKGTKITGGRGKGIVVATGMQTVMGNIATMVQDNEGETPLQKRMNDFSKKLSFIIVFLCVFLFGIGYIRGENPIYMFLTAISLAVAAIPEALPALITIALARAAKKMVDKNVLIRKLNAVETLGSITYICTDKTGTLTQNKMKVIERYDEPSRLSISDNILTLDLCISLNHDVGDNKNGKLTGEPTEIALAEYFVQIHGMQKMNYLRTKHNRVFEFPFDSTRKCMTTIHRMENMYLIVCKGAAETLSNYMRPEIDTSMIHKKVDEFSTKGMRVIVYGFKLVNELPAQPLIDEIEYDLHFAGIVGMIDPPREEVKDAIHNCKTAGIQVVMITGDHPKTAGAIASQIGLLNSKDLVITGKELNELNDVSFEEKIERIRVYARVSPEQKLKIIHALQKKKHFVAMTGDGVNDAPALKISNIGIAMGISGTDVSKQVAQMILLDDNFASIVKGIKEGRRIFDNIRKFVKYIMTCNAAEIWTLLLAPFLGLPIPLLPIHILWINLITDGIPGLTLANEKHESNIMNRPPRKTNESLFSGGIGFHIVWVSLCMAAITLGIQAWSISQENKHWQTMVFTVLSFSQLAHVLAIKRDEILLINNGLFSNMSIIWAVLLTFILQLVVIYLPFANNILKTAPLTVNELLICIGGAIIMFHALELEKIIKKMLIRKNLMVQRE